MAVKVYTASVGLDTVHDPKNIQYDPRTGVAALKSAVNVRIDKSGKIARCAGFASVASGNYHSGWFDKELAFCGVGTSLYSVTAGGGISGIRSGLSGDRIDYARHGDTVYYSNGKQNGRIINNVSYAWSIGTYIGPDDKVVRTAAPVARHLGMFNGRMYLSDAAEPNVLYWSLPGQPRIYERVGCHKKFESDILMIAPLNSGDTGIFVSTEQAIYFLAIGEQVTRKKVADYPAYEWSLSCKKYACRDLGFDMDGDAVIWLGKNGVCAGLPNGSMVNLTDKLVKLDSISCGGTGATVIIASFCISALDNLCLITQLELGGIGEKPTTQRTNYGFNSFVEKEGIFYGLSSAGIYSLGGSDDDGTEISAYFETCSSGFGASDPTRVQYLYISGAIDGDMIATVTSNEDSNRSYSYSVAPETTEFHKMAVKLGEGELALNRSIKLENVAGCDFAIQDMEILTTELQRKNRY